MKELNYDENSKVLNQKDEVISFKCELQENLQNSLKTYFQYRVSLNPYFEILFASKNLQ